MQAKTKDRLIVSTLTLIAFIVPFGMVVAVENNRKLDALGDDVKTSFEGAIEMLPIPVEKEKTETVIATPPPIKTPDPVKVTPKTTTVQSKQTTTTTTTTTTKPKSTRKTKTS